MMYLIQAEEIKRSIFDAIKGGVLGEPILFVLLFLILGIGGAYLKANAEVIKEKYPILYAVILIVLLAIIIFSIWMFFASSSK